MRTVDVMRNIAIEAKPEAEADLRKAGLAAALDKHFPFGGGWRGVPLQYGEQLLRDLIAGQPA